MIILIALTQSLEVTVMLSNRLSSIEGATHIWSTLFLLISAITFHLDCSKLTHSFCGDYLAEKQMNIKLSSNRLSSIEGASHIWSNTFSALQCNYISPRPFNIDSFIWCDYRAEQQVNNILSFMNKNLDHHIYIIINDHTWTNMTINAIASPRPVKYWNFIEQ